jgi:restriction system protein
MTRDDDALPPFAGSSTSDATRSVLEHYRHRQAEYYAAGVYGHTSSGGATLTGVAATGAAGSLSAHIDNEVLEAADEATANISLPVIILNFVIVFASGGGDEGQLIRACGPAWFSILEQLDKSPDVFLKMTPREFEEFLAGAYHRSGFARTILTPASGDGGRDVIAVHEDFGTIRILDQAKLYKPGHLVTANDVRAMCHTVDNDRRASKCVVTTTSDFAPGVYAEFADRVPSRLELRNGTKLVEWLGSIRERR